MKSITVTQNEAGQRLDKLLLKYLNKAPSSFIYKMLRKKNITLNGKKASGNEKTVLNDEIKFFLSDETIENFSELHIEKTDAKLDIIYENEHILLINKPVGMLSQKANASDISLVEHLISYLLETKAITEESLRSFKPGICNRLDRNTSGIIVAGKSLAGLQSMTEIFRNRSIHKYYLCLVTGIISESRQIQGFLTKDEKENQVAISLRQTHKDAMPIKTEYRPLASHQDVTLLEVKLITGRSHQIRAHLASIGHPIIGDKKYGNARINAEYWKAFGLKHQLLHSYRLEMPQSQGVLSELSGNVFFAKPPQIFRQITKKKGLSQWQPGIPED